MTTSSEARIYVIDTCALLDLEGYNHQTAFTRDPRIQARVWSGLISMIQEGRLVTVRAVKEEIERKSPSIVKRLKVVWALFGQQDSVELLAETQRVIGQFGKLVPHIEKLPANRDPGDPYVVAYAQLYGVRVVTNELPRCMRTRNSRKEIHIPDACNALGIHCDRLGEFIQYEGL